MSGLQPTTMNPDASTRLQQYMHAHIPLVAQMQVRVDGYEEAGLRLSAPLAPNINHERTAFGGSLASLLTLACWGYLWLMLEDRQPLHIVVKDAHLDYLKPVSGRLAALCPQPAADTLERFLETLTRRGKARLELDAVITQNGETAVRYRGSFAVYREGPQKGTSSVP